MRPYEVMIILEANLDEEVIRGVIDRTVELVKQGEGEAGTVDRWGKRRFAYELHHKWEGYYVIVSFNAPATAIVEIDRFLSLADDVIRHKVMRLPDDHIEQRKAAAGVQPVGAN